MSDYQAQVAAFLARGGAVKVVAEGEGMNLSAKEWYNKVSDGPAKTDIGPACIAEDGDMLAREAYCSAKMNGASDEAAWEDYDAAKG